MHNKIAEILGWYGMVVILIGFILISFDYVNSHSLVYQILNCTGAAGIAINAYIKRDHPAMTLNVLFALVALVSLIRLF